MLFHGALSTAFPLRDSVAGITPDLEIGVHVGWGLSDDSARFFVNAGIGQRF